MYGQKIIDENASSSSQVLKGWFPSKSVKILHSAYTQQQNKTQQSENLPEQENTIESKKNE